MHNNNAYVNTPPINIQYFIKFGLPGVRVSFYNTQIDFKNKNNNFYIILFKKYINKKIEIPNITSDKKQSYNHKNILQLH